MKIFINHPHPPNQGLLKTVLKVMKLSTCLMLLFVVQVSAKGYSQLVTIHLKNVTFTALAAELEVKTGYRFLFSADQVQKMGTKDVAYTDVDFTTVLDDFMEHSGITYRIVDDTVVLVPAPPQQPQQPQLYPVSGVVLDEYGKPLVGAAVQLQGTRTGVSTNVEGNYQISVPAGSKLLFSHIGYLTQTIEVGTRGLINVQMVVAEEEIQDVIVTGYRTITKEHATGAYTVLMGDLLEQAPVANISSALKGLVPGLTAASKNDEGDDTRFLIRGIGTFQAQVDRDPLVVVDGFPLSGNYSSNNPLSSINPNDVETITVLKDAAATSIYGARAANGVIVVTTKKGRSGEKIYVNVSAFTQMNSRYDLDHRYDLASPETLFWHAENKLKYDPTYNLTDLYANPVSPFNDRRKDNEMMLFEWYRLGKMTEQEYNARKVEMIAAGNKGLWKDDLNKYFYRNRVHQQYNVAIRGGSTTHNYSFSTAYDKEDSYLRGTDQQRIMLNFNNSIKFGPKVTLNIGVNGNIRKDNGSATQTFAINPWTRFVDNEGNFLHHPINEETIYYPILMDRYGDKLPVNWFYNPIENAQYTKNESARYIVRVNAGLDYYITKSLKVKIAGQYEFNQYLATQFYDPESFQVRSYVNKYSTLNAATGKYVTYFPDGGMFYESGNRYEGYMFRFQTDFNKSFGHHAVTILAGTEVMSSTSITIPTTYRYGFNRFTNAVLTSLDYITQRPTIFGVNERLPFTPPALLNTNEDRFFSAYIDAQYTFKDRYNLTASVRTDASNYQAIEIRDKFSPFWSVGAAWLISKEGFIKEAQWLSLLKLRATVGEAGIAAGKRTNSAIPTVSVDPPSIPFSNNEPYNTMSSKGNPTLTWEKSRTFDLGVDFKLWGDKLYGGFSYYDRYSYDVLAPASVPMIAQGSSTATFNNASISNRGVELSLGTHLKIAGDFRWDGLLTFSYNKNKVVEYNVINTSIRPDYYAGYPVEGIWAFNIHRYTEEGYQVLLGKDGAEEIVVDRATSHFNEVVPSGVTLEEYNWSYYLGSPIPTHHLGFINSFSFKGITLSFKMTGKFGYFFRGDGDMAERIDGRLLEYAKKVWDEGYGNQTSYTSLPLFNADNAKVFSANRSYNDLFSNTHLNSSACYYRGDHIRLNELYLGYELPDKLLAKSKIVKSVKVYAQAKNLGMVWSLNDLYDPESLPGSFKPPIIFTLGLNFNFNFN